MANKPVRFVHFSDWYGLVGVLRIRSLGRRATLILQCRGELRENSKDVCEVYCALQKCKSSQLQGNLGLSVGLLLPRNANFSRLRWPF